MKDFESIITFANQIKASDVHICYNQPVLFRVDGLLKAVDDEVLSEEDTYTLAEQLAGAYFVTVEQIGELDLAKTICKQRLRINIFKQQGHFSIAIRLLHDHIPNINELGLPPIANDFPTYNNGIVLITGETGSGKSTSLAAILNEINHTRYEHIITLEDPIEYVYEPSKCLISQREIGKDTRSFSDGLRASLREDPDVILIGEMRDIETIEIALTAAETGHLVFATVHTNGAAETIDRIVGIFPADRQPMIGMQLSQSLRAVVSQQLLPKANQEGRVLAAEVMVVTPAIKNLIREMKTPQMESSIMTDSKVGSITMDAAVKKLYEQGVISLETAKDASKHPEKYEMNYGSMSSPRPFSAYGKR